MRQTQSGVQSNHAFFFPCVGLTCNTDISYEAGDSPYKVPPDWLIQDYEDHPKWCF